MVVREERVPDRAHDDLPHAWAENSIDKDENKGGMKRRGARRRPETNGGHARPQALPAVYENCPDDPSAPSKDLDVQASSCPRGI